MRTRANKQSGATIKDVADLAGVSAMTVSRVLNSGHRVRPATQERVEAAIRELNYRPNLSARSLAKARSLFIGLLYNNPNPGYVSELLIGLMNRCRQVGYHLVIENFGSTDEEWAADIDGLLSSSNFDGLIVAPPVSDFDSVISAIERADLPCVRIAPEQEPDLFASVRTDDRDAARRMTRHLLDLGHRRLGFIAGDAGHGASRQRMSGFCAALEDAGIELEDALIVEGRFTYRSGLAAAEKLLSMPEPPTAIFASNDDMAAAVVGVAARKGIDVPGQLSVAGFDDTHTATTLWPQLTTVRQPIADMAGAAVDLLTAAINAEPDQDVAQTQRLLPCEVIIRDSSCPVAPDRG
ncbi:LacI family DNA-binding transcriptional regulator [Maricaulis sp.]|uniref:LacI family DNA-binding transcriptional regulator n=1 Tax=Maricaulis sp. TaxID=1486257 RepID=UPI0026098F88|nr:LacI family DNA-binding transcriptional regulator [Maricaulis sp.]